MDIKRMAIEQNTQQEQFTNEWHKLRVNLLHSANWLVTAIKDFLEPFGLTQKQFNILRILRGHKEEMPLSILDIRERMIDKMSDASRIIDRLAKKGLLRKKPCTMDKRTVRIYITDEGLAILKQIDAKAHELDAILHQLNKQQAVEMNQLLDRMRGDV